MADDRAQVTEHDKVSLDGVAGKTKTAVIQGGDLKLKHLRQLIAMTEGWSDDCSVEPVTRHSGLEQAFVNKAIQVNWQEPS